MRWPGMKLLLALLTLASPAAAQVLTGAAAYGDWRTDAPGTRRHLTPQDLPPPFASRSASNTPSVMAQPAGALPRVPPGFTVQRLAAGLENPRMIRVAPNGDVFVAETGAGRIRVLRAGGINFEMFATRLERPFGIAFWPAGADPRWVYVATLNQVVRLPYKPGPNARPQVIVPEIAPSTGYHTTRDVQFSPDGSRMYVSVGSGSNVAEGMGRKDPAEIAAWEAAHGRGAAWGNDTRRANVLAFDPDGGAARTYATGIRNCVGMAIQPGTGDVWCATNERDGLGDNLPPDYVTRVRDGGFYGWPWYYMGAHEDPRRPGERPDLKAQATVPDVLIQPHSAPLGLAFYTGTAFPAAYRGDAFVALHGSWNRGKRTGYKVVRIRMKDSVATGEYEDFMTGFVANDEEVWGRPVGVAVAADGALLVTEDGNGTVWRIAYTEGPKP